MLIIHMILADAPPEAAVSAEEDRVLVKRALEDLTAFTGLYQRHARRVYRYILSRVGNVQDAQDLTSQTFIAAMESLAKYRGDSAFGAWLLGIARFKVADHFRAKRPQVVLEAAIGVSDSSDAADVIGRKLQIEQVVAKMQTLSPDRAEAIALRLFGGLEVVEVARMMEKSEASVRMLVYRGLQDLQKQLNVKEEDLS